MNFTSRTTDRHLLLLLLLFGPCLDRQDSWAICRIFKKANTMAQRALSHSWVSPSLPPASTDMDMFSQDAFCTQFSPDSVSCTTETRSPIQAFCAPLDPSSCKPANNNALATCYNSSRLPVPNGDLPSSYYFLSPHETPAPPPPKPSVDVASMLLNNLSPGLAEGGKSVGFEEPQQRLLLDGYPMNLLQGMQGNMGNEENGASLRKNAGPNANYSYQWGNVRYGGFPFS